MTLPASRDLNCSPGATAVTATLLNDLQDCIIALNNLVTGQANGFWTNVALSGALTVGGQPLSFGPSTFTANAALDLLAVTGHGLQTGYGPLRLTTTGTLPGGLATATDYWALSFDADHFSLATSFFNALIGKQIDILDAGTGTHTAASTGATTRKTDATVSRNLLVNGLVQNPRTIKVPVSAPTTGASVTAQPVTITTAAQWFGQIPELVVGQTIVAVRARVKDSATGPTKLQAVLTPSVDGVVGSPLATSPVSSGSGTAQYITAAQGGGTPVVAGTQYIASVNITTGATNCTLYEVEVDVV